MLPCADTHEQIQVRAPWRQRWASAEPSHRACTHVRRPAAIAVGDNSEISRGYVDRLFPPMRAWVGRAGEIGVQYRHFLARVLFDEPCEAGPKHGGGGSEKGLAQRLKGGEGDVYIGEEGFGADLGRVFRCWCESAEHEMVVVSHGGTVEERGRVRIARIFDDQVLDFGPFIRTSRRQFIQPVDSVALVLGPCHIKAIGRQHLSDAISRKGFAVCKRRHKVSTAALSR